MAHGKSTVVKAISGVQTVRFKNELERNITIKLGYANAKIYKAKDPRVPRCSLNQFPAGPRLPSDAMAVGNVRAAVLLAGRHATKHMAAARKTRLPATSQDMSTLRWSSSAMFPLWIAQVWSRVLLLSSMFLHSIRSRDSCCSAVWIVSFKLGRAGHDILMATMLNGAAVMDGALLLIAANETCPQPQTSEHLAAVEIMRLEHIIILQNKIDLIRCGPCPL